MDFLNRSFLLLRSSRINADLLTCLVGVLTHENFSDHYPILMKWPINVDIEQNYLPFRDISFIKDQEKRSNYLTDLDWNLRNRCLFRI